MGDLTPVELAELIVTLIAVLVCSITAMVGLWTLFGPEPYRENRRLSRIQHVVTWLGRHGKAWRVL